MSYFISYSVITIASLFGFVASIGLRDRKHLTLGFSAGALVAAAMLVLLPESVERLAEAHLSVVIAFMVSAIIFVALTVSSKHDHAQFVGPGAVASHSFFDGLAGGLAGIVVGVAYIPIIASLAIHRFTDGLTVGSLTFRKSLHKKLVLIWLGITIFLPLLGIAVAEFVTISEAFIGIVFSVLAGVFLYIGVVDILPELRHHHAKLPTFISIAIGFLIVGFLAYMGAA